MMPLGLPVVPDENTMAAISAGFGLFAATSKGFARAPMSP
jgi:hypothetical protein